MLFLNASEVRACLTDDVALDAAEEALLIQEGDAYTMPKRHNIGCGSEGSVLLVMPCKTEAALATKLVTVFPENSARGLPVIDGVVVLNDLATGELLAIMDGKSLTAIRTAAATGVSVRHLAPLGTECLGLVGCGVQAFDQVRLACAAHPIQRVLLGSRTSSSRDFLRERLAAELPQVDVQAVASIEHLMAECQVLITATSAREPVLPNDPALYEGKHCVAMGSFEPAVREYPDAIFSRTAKVWVDTLEAVSKSGELMLPLGDGLLQAGQIETLGSLIQSGEAPDRGEYGTTFFKSVGMALLDLQAAQAVYEQAKVRGLGMPLQF
jgi:ornithine cyclodeaminase/alanine dehydrogenase-like protein (mu-crystallin family)